VGGIVPDIDIPYLVERGVAAVLGPGCTTKDIIRCVRECAVS
jgi:methylmalonyl-CoA mutase cobalamin-binding domain/chain